MLIIHEHGIKHQPINQSINLKKLVVFMWNQN